MLRGFGPRKSSGPIYFRFGFRNAVRWAMARPLPALRDGLDYFPSPDRLRPGLVILDRSGYSDAQILVPPGMVRALAAFDGEHTADALPAEVAEELQSVLSQCGFLDDEVFASMRDKALTGWRNAEVIPARHFGVGKYPQKEQDARVEFNLWLKQNPGREVASPLSAIAAPHASPGQTREAYAAAYGQLRRSLPPEAAQEKTFVILGTSHNGPPNRFGTTRKSFETPFGVTAVDQDLLMRLNGPGFEAEDYCFSTEHSIEFQVVFLQWLYGQNIKILPILCGSFMESIYKGSQPEENEAVLSSLETLCQLNVTHGRDLVWVLGIDLAHVGRRYGDAEAARADQMPEVLRRDHARLAAVQAGEAESFWSQIQENRDDLKWCGSSPLYTFLRAVPQQRGTLLDYRHWQIDPESVVSVAALHFTPR